jgi:hypothetical protein
MAHLGVKPFSGIPGPEQLRPHHKARKKTTATQRAVEAVRDVGKLKRLTFSDVAGIYHVSETYLRALHRLPLHQQQDVADGTVRLSDIVNRRDRQQMAANKVDEMIAEVGIERVWNALERATRPNGNGHSND